MFVLIARTFAWRVSKSQNAKDTEFLSQHYAKENFTAGANLNTRFSKYMRNQILYAKEKYYLCETKFVPSANPVTFCT